MCWSLAAFFALALAILAPTPAPAQSPDPAPRIRPDISPTSATLAAPAPEQPIPGARRTVLSPLPASPPELLERPIVRELVIEGLDTVTTGTVTRVLRTEIGRPFDLDEFRKDVSSLAQLGYFDPLKIGATYQKLPDGIRVRLRLRENPRIHSYQIIGTLKFTVEQIIAELPQKEGEILHSLGEDKIRKAVRSFYSGGGYKQVQVTVKRSPLPNDEKQVDVVVLIDEGERLKIRDLILRGNSSYASWYLKARLSNTGSWFLFDNYYDDELFQTDLETIRAFYVDRGYLDVKVRAGTPETGEEKGEISPVIEIEEGLRYRVSQVVVRGQALFLDAEVHAPFEPLLGAPYDGEDLRAAIEELRQLYGNEGYIDLDVRVKNINDPESATTRLEVTLKEGEVQYVGDVKVALNRYEPTDDLNAIEEFFAWVSPPTKEETVRREVRLKPGRKYRRYEEIRTEERLRRLQIFDKITIRREPTEDPQVKNAVIEAEEASNAGYLSAAVGYGEYSGAALTLSYVNPNIAGEGKVLRAQTTLGQRTRRFAVRYLNRHWEDSENSLELAGYFSLDRYAGYQQRLIGASGEVGIPLDEYLTFYARQRIEHVNFHRRSKTRREPLDPYWVTATRGLFEWDYRDDPRWPTKGFRFALGAEGGYADGGLLKFLHSFGYYRTLFGTPLVWAYEHDFGVMPYRYSRVGISERFFLGGSNDVRGFSLRGASPVDAGDNDLRIGGSTKFAQRNEIRFPIAGALKGRVFLDDGFIGKTPLTLTDPRLSTGLGFMLDLKIVGVEVDFARALMYERNDSRRFLHFRITSGF